MEIMYMKLSRFALVTGVSAAMAVAALPSHAMVYGVAGESVLGPLVMNDTVNTGTGNTNTYVVLKLPSVLGSDFVLNNYSAPNIRAGVPAGTAKVIQPDPDYGWEVHWTWFDPKSKNPKNGTCEGSADDVIIWTTDQTLLNIQRQVDVGQQPTGPVPRTFCGSSSLPAAGYVVFQTARGADSLEADFAMEATGYITDANLAENTTALLSLPMIPMADGEDTCPSTKDSSPQLGLNEVIQPVTSTCGFKADNISISPVVASPLATGIRMNDGNPGTDLAVTFAGGVQGNFLPGPAYSLHVLWFDRNNEDRTSDSQVLLWDEHEFAESLEVPIDYELNMILWNADGTLDPVGTPVWPNLGGAISPTAVTYVDLIGSIMADELLSFAFNPPFNWNFSIMGYAEYQVKEEGDELGGPGGTPGTNAAMVAFEAQEDMQNGDAWSQHLMTLRGFR
jgi:hypothetical protein